MTSIGPFVPQRRTNSAPICHPWNSPSDTRRMYDHTRYSVQTEPDFLTSQPPNGYWNVIEAPLATPVPVTLALSDTVVDVSPTTDVPAGIFEPVTICPIETLAAVAKVSVLPLVVLAVVEMIGFHGSGQKLVRMSCVLILNTSVPRSTPVKFHAISFATISALSCARLTLGVRDGAPMAAFSVYVSMPPAVKVSGDTNDSAANLSEPSCFQ